MRYLPILEELFESDSGILAVIALAVSLLIGIAMKSSKKNLHAVSVCLLAYAVCEVLCNFHTNFLIELVSLFVGTAALGGTVGFLIGSIVARARKAT